MKKVFAILLTVAMLATVLAVSVSAAKEVGGDDGVTTFPETITPGANLSVQVSDVTHKYAVDVTFDFSPLVIGGTIEWDVNNLKYVSKGTTLEDAQRTITVDNRSDLPVYAYANVTDKDSGDGITVTAATYSESNKLEIAKAMAGIAGANGTHGTGTLPIDIKGNTWEDVIAYYGAKKAAGSGVTFTVATVTVTITMN